MSKIVWLASYPKSGNTWVRFILAHLLYTNIESSANVHGMIPDIHRGVNAGQLIGSHTLFVKSHLKYFDEMPLREDSVGVIYVVRNPLDMIASAINYFALSEPQTYLAASEEERHRLRQSLIDEFIDQGAPKLWLQLGMGTWSEHVESWHRNDLPFPRITLRYKDMKAKPRECVAQLCRFLNIEKTPEQIDAALAAASFENMRAMEEREVAEGRPGFFTIENPVEAFSQGLRFVNKGETGGYRKVLTEAQIAAARRRFGPTMRRLGYT